jgi:hypothetical protein
MSAGIVRHVRVYAEPIGKNKDQASAVFIDLCINDANVAVGKWIALGLSGDHTDETGQVPFIVRQIDGTVDYGGSADRAGEARYCKTDLCESVIKVG